MHKSSHRNGAPSRRAVLPLIASLVLTGCGTLHSLSGPKRSAPCIYSGVRLDWAAIQGDAHYISRYSLTAPDHPAADLPFSFAADSLFLPLSLIRASYQAVFVPDDL